MKKKILIVLLILVAIIAGIFIIKNINSRKYDYKIEEISEFNYYIYQENNQYGIIDKNGKKIIDANYSNLIIPNPEKDIFVCYAGDKAIILNSKNETQFTEYDEIIPIKLKSAASTLAYEKSVLIYRKDGLYGLIDFNGKKITKNIYESIENLQPTEGKFLVSKDEKYGVIDLKGNEIVKPEYDKIVSDGYYTQKDKYKKSGFVVYKKTDDGYKCGFITYNGKSILDTKYNEIERISKEDDKNIYLIAAENGKKGLYKNSKNIITDFSNVLKRYGFSLNSEKTSESEFPYYLVQNFKRAVEDILVFEGSTVGRDALMELFNHFFKLENKGVKGAIRYLIKLIDQGINDIEFDDNELYKSYLVNIMVNNERSLNKACSILINNRDKYKLNKSDIHTIKEILDKYILYGYDLEVIWLVYLLVMTDNSDSLSGQIDNILKSNNDLAKLILYDAGLIDEEKLHNLINYAKSWILLYELYSNNAILEDELIEKLNLQSSESKNFYKKISASNIHFIDLDRRESNLYEK